MSWIIEVKPSWPIQPGELEVEEWAPVGDNLAAPFDSEFASEAEALSFLRIIEWSIASASGYQNIAPTTPPRQFRVRELV